MSNIFISRLIRLPQQSLRFGSGRGRLRSEGLLGVSSWKVDGWGTATCRLDRRHLSSTVDGSDDEEERGVPPILSVAIVGTGPSGFYTAKYLRAAAEKMNVDARIDLIERLPTPYGLVRSGVAPDHPEVKNVENDFRLMFTEHPESFHFVGNVNVGRDVSLDELRQFYQVVVLAYGCESDRKLGIEGEDTLHGVLSAREFVAWYNGHPDFVHIGDQSAELLSSPEESQVVVIGQGNVALDCARILAKGAPGLLDTDISAHTLPILKNGVKKTVVLGRRGHVQGAFTIKELRELTKLQTEGHDTNFVVREDELELGATTSSIEELNSKGSRPKVRIDKLLRQAAEATIDVQASKQIDLRFLLNPIKFVPDESESSRLGSVVCERTRLEGEPGHQVAVGTGEQETIQANLALVSIGYKGVPLPGLKESLFDEGRGVVKNIHGKVGDSISAMEDGLFVSGWLKRGPSGIIGTNIVDAKDTVASIISDMEGGQLPNNVSGRDGFVHLLEERGIQLVDWDAYNKINECEQDPHRKRTDTQPREKITSVEEMLQLCQK